MSDPVVAKMVRDFDPYNSLATNTTQHFDAGQGTLVTTGFRRRAGRCDARMFVRQRHRFTQCLLSVGCPLVLPLDGGAMLNLYQVYFAASMAGLPVGSLIPVVVVLVCGGRSLALAR
eukprot:7863252-Pyramimonas_sp.AAC.1